MKANLLFQIELDYQTTPYVILKEKAVYIAYDKQEKKFLWLFYLRDLNIISGIIGKPITFETQEQNIKRLIELCPPLKEKINLDQYKGVGEYTFVEQPEIFEVGEWQKDPKTGQPKQSWQRIPKEIILVNWEIIKDYPFGKWVKIRTQAEHVCRRLGFDKLFRDSGTFDWVKFTGMHRKGHLPYVYYPIKILAHLGVIEYSRIGKIKKIKDKLEFQYQFMKNVSNKDIIKEKN